LDRTSQAVHERFGGLTKAIRCAVKLVHDHGYQFKGSDLQRNFRFPDIEHSPAFVPEPVVIGCAERFFDTLKEQLLWVARLLHLGGADPALAPTSGPAQRTLGGRKAHAPVRAAG
jgi:hypothetical protein